MFLKNIHGLTFITFSTRVYKETNLTHHQLSSEQDINTTEMEPIHSLNLDRIDRREGNRQEESQEENTIAVFKWRDNKFFTGLILGALTLCMICTILCISALIMSKGNNISRIICNIGHLSADSPQDNPQGGPQPDLQTGPQADLQAGSQAHPRRITSTTIKPTRPPPTFTPEGSGLARLPDFGDGTDFRNY